MQLLAEPFYCVWKWDSAWQDQECVKVWWLCFPNCSYRVQRHGSLLQTLSASFLMHLIFPSSESCRLLFIDQFLQRVRVWLSLWKQRLLMYLYSLSTSYNSHWFSHSPSLHVNKWVTRDTKGLAMQGKSGEVQSVPSLSGRWRRAVQRCLQRISQRNALQPQTSQKTVNYLVWVTHLIFISEELNIYFRKSRHRHLWCTKKSSEGFSSSFSWKWSALQHTGLGEGRGWAPPAAFCLHVQ